MQNLFDLTGKKALVTGGSKGIGNRLARGLHDAGAEVVIFYNSTYSEQMAQEMQGDGPAVYYTVPGWKGDIGFIAAVHGKFCASCNRVRLTSQGFLRPCLASETGCDLKALLRSGASDEELLTAIRTTIWEKPQEHHFELKQDIPATRGMYRIGG